MEDLGHLPLRGSIFLWKPRWGGFDTSIIDVGGKSLSSTSLLVVSFAGKRASNDEYDWDVGVGPGERGHVEYLP